MKTIKIFTLLFFFTILIACDKQDNNNNSENSDVLNITAIKKGSTSDEVVNLRLKSGKAEISPIGCHVFESVLFDSHRNGFGYCNCDSVFIIINPISGDTLTAIKLPNDLTNTFVDTAVNRLVGLCRIENTFNIMQFSLDSNKLISQKPVNLNDGWFGCTYFYNQTNHELCIINSNQELISINPDNGEIVKSVPIEAFLQNNSYDENANRLYGMDYSIETDSNYVITIDVETGKLIKKTRILERDNYFACSSAYDVKSNSYIVVTEDNEIIFIDTETGEITERYPLDFDIDEFKFWRGTSN